MTGGWPTSGRLMPTVLLVKLLDAAGRIKKLLLSRVERMAVLTNFHVQVAHGGAGLERIAAHTRDARFLVRGMNSRFHCYLLRSLLSPKRAIRTNNVRS